MIRAKPPLLCGFALLKEKMKKINKIVLVIGILSFLYSLTLEPFKNYDIFQNKTMEIGESVMETKNKYTEYDKLRNSHLTIKYEMFDYSMIMIITSLFVGFISFAKKANVSKLKKMLLGFLSFLSLILSFYIDLFIYVSRDGAPYWGDLIGIPMYYIGEITIYILIYFAFNLL